VAAVSAFVEAIRIDRPGKPAWIDIDAEAFFLDPAIELPRLYSRYRDVGGTAAR
jgi:hypothetical protein